ncbi:kinase-like domain-containing protein [Infundibulicybe gibba]|nr:kinase-like domain-containing protein [Infundibulicybe gibba]
MSSLFWDAPRVLDIILNHIYTSFISSQDLSGHYCSLENPCKAVAQILSPFTSLRLVSSTWNAGVQRCNPLAKYAFFSRIETAYYPHPWHINTRVRKAIILGRYRVATTISAEGGDRGVYLAYDISSDIGCSSKKMVVIKAWLSPSDAECLMEAEAYRSLSSPSLVSGTPGLLASEYDATCGVYALVLERLGPSLEDIRPLFPGHRFSEQLVLCIAIQMLDRYKEIHSRGIIHNGIKPGNICLERPALPTAAASKLYAIDFGLSSLLERTENPLPSGRRLDAIGNRNFLSVFGHHGISQSQRDDLESLAYLFSYLFHGSLPWEHPPPKAADGSKPQLWRIKISTPSSVLFRDMDPSFLDFWKDVRALAFAEIPNYDVMRQRFVECWTRRGYAGCPGEVDWVACCADLVERTQW